MNEHPIFYRRHLPHYQPPGATLFVTTRLAGSLPEQVAEQLVTEAEHLEMLRLHLEDESERARQSYLDQRRLFARWDRELDVADFGPLWLANQQVAELVADALHYRDGRVYRLDAFCIMANHLHLVFKPLEKTIGNDYSLRELMQSLKGYTAYKANRLLHRRGQFWQHESYDHVVRNVGEHERVIRYVLNNPVNAGLVQDWQDWPWSYCRVLP